MDRAAFDRHNALAPRLARELLQGTQCACEAMIVLESIVFGVMIAQAGNRAIAVRLLEQMTERVVARMVDESFMPETLDAARARGAVWK